jgi:nitrous oxidase accessory protein
LKQSVSIIVLLLLISTVTVSFFQMGLVKADPNTIVVPDDYSTINGAISHASGGDTIIIRNGTYTEQTLEINKSLTITSEYVNGAKISLHPPLSPAGTPWGGIIMVYDYPIRIYADDVLLSGCNITSDGGDISANGNRIQILNNTMITERTGISVYITGNESQILGNTMAGLIVVGSNNTARDNYSASISVSGSFNFIIKNDAGGIALIGSRNVVDGNSFVTTGGVGIWIINADYNTITNNIVVGSNVGIAIGYANPSGSYNIFAGNTVEGSSLYGILLRNGSGNVFYGNRIANNSGYGLVLGGYRYDRETDNNLFFHNIFVNNTQDFDWDVNGSNFFDNGTEGNYWDDYLAKYPSATELDHSGVGNTPYLVYANTMDNYPLMNEPDVSAIVPALPNPWSQLSLINPAGINTIPEFPSWTPLLIMLTAMVAITVIYSRKLTPKNQGIRDQ